MKSSIRNIIFSLLMTLLLFMCEIDPQKTIDPNAKPSWNPTTKELPAVFKGNGTAKSISGFDEVPNCEVDATFSLTVYDNVTCMFEVRFPTSFVNTDGKCEIMPDDYQSRKMTGVMGNGFDYCDLKRYPASEAITLDETYNWVWIEEAGAYARATIALRDQQGKVFESFEASYMKR